MAKNKALQEGKDVNLPPISNSNADLSDRSGPDQERNYQTKINVKNDQCQNGRALTTHCSGDNLDGENSDSQANNGILDYADSHNAIGRYRQSFKQKIDESKMREQMAQEKILFSARDRLSQLKLLRKIQIEDRLQISNRLLTRQATARTRKASSRKGRARLP